MKTWKVAGGQGRWKRVQVVPVKTTNTVKKLAYGLIMTWYLAGLVSVGTGYQAMEAWPEISCECNHRIASSEPEKWRGGKAARDKKQEVEDPTTAREAQRKWKKKPPARPGLMDLVAGHAGCSEKWGTGCLQSRPQI